MDCFWCHRISLYYYKILNPNINKGNQLCYQTIKWKKLGAGKRQPNHVAHLGFFYDKLFYLGRESGYLKPGWHIANFIFKDEIYCSQVPWLVKKAAQAIYYLDYRLEVWQWGWNVEQWVIAFLLQIIFFSLKLDFDLNIQLVYWYFSKSFFDYQEILCTNRKKIQTLISLSTF